MSRAEPFGLHLWFDPDTEFPRLYELEPGAERGVPAVREVDDWSGQSDPDQSKQLFHQEELPF